MIVSRRQHGRQQRLGRIPLPSVLPWLAAATALLAGGCGSKPAPQPTLPQEFYQPAKAVQEVPVAHILRRDYRLREGDQLEIIYHVRHQKTNSYRIQLQDVIEIRFPFHAQLNQTAQVQSDGTLQPTDRGDWSSTAMRMQTDPVQRY